jgi:hypothetical protein
MGLRLYFKINSVVMLGRDESGISDGSELEFLVFDNINFTLPQYDVYPSSIQGMRTFQQSKLLDFLIWDKLFLI